MLLRKGIFAGALFAGKLWGAIRANAGGGWGRFLGLEPRRARLKKQGIPEEIILIIEEIVERNPTAPVKQFRQELKRLDIEALAKYIKILKEEIAIEIKRLIAARIEEEDELIMLMVM